MKMLDSLTTTSSVTALVNKGMGTQSETHSIGRPKYKNIKPKREEEDLRGKRLLSTGSAAANEMKSCARGTRGEAVTSRRHLCIVLID
jgi:hypothetical protein